jgi:hypothetical protein
MKEHLTIFVNDNPVKVHCAMKVKHALIAFDQSLYDACRDGRVIVETEDGMRVDLEGALSEGSRIVTKDRVGLK